MKAGDRVEITGIMRDEPNPLPVGTKGTIEEVHREVGQIWVDWDEDADGHKRSLILLTTDPFRVIT